MSSILLSSIAKIGSETKEITEEIPFEIPENWEFIRLKNLSDAYTGNSISESVKQSKYTNLKEGYNYIGTKDVGFNHIINYENGVKIPFNETSFKYAYKNAILLCIEGGSAGRKVGIVSEKVKAEKAELIKQGKIKKDKQESYIYKGTDN